MIKLIILVLSVFIFSISYGYISNHNTFYCPVEEIYVDELPESIMDMELIHSVSKLPVVFRGAAKNWEAMNWTPESLEKRGLKGIEKDVMQSPLGNPRRTYYGLSVHLLEDTRKIDLDYDGANYTSQSELMEILKDIHYYEINPKNVGVTDRVLIRKNLGLYYLKELGKYTLYILAGSKGYQMPVFHNHASALLAEFYGERMVFLAQPFTEKKLRDNELSDEMDRVIKRHYNEELDSGLDVNNGDYFPFQQVILKPGDILYIPSGWYHKVHYLTPCIGTTQFIEMNTKNVSLNSF